MKAYYILHVALILAMA